MGAGPARLAASATLTARGVEHVVLERGRVGESWRTQRWDSFRLNTPGWMNQMLSRRGTRMRLAPRSSRGSRHSPPCVLSTTVHRWPGSHPPATGTPCRRAVVTFVPAPSWSPVATRTCRRLRPPTTTTAARPGDGRRQLRPPRRGQEEVRPGQPVPFEATSPRRPDSHSSALADLRGIRPPAPRTIGQTQTADAPDLERCGPVGNRTDGEVAAVVKASMAGARSALADIGG